MAYPFCRCLTDAAAIAKRRPGKGSRPSRPSACAGWGALILRMSLIRGLRRGYFQTEEADFSKTERKSLPKRAKLVWTGHKIARKAG